MFASKGYWPINYDHENFKIPENYMEVFENYGSKFMKNKVMRKLIWHYQLGCVDLTLEFDNGSIDVKCLPIHAVLISYFDDNSK